MLQSVTQRESCIRSGACEPYTLSCDAGVNTVVGLYASCVLQPIAAYPPAACTHVHTAHGLGRYATHLLVVADGHHVAFLERLRVGDVRDHDLAGTDFDHLGLMD